ncbi:VOC family protein [Paludisphaera soli]|uniref:VOC family protein n=1 Tax=Paludisphaera soli TaxID=2712865 RepID=UPI0013E9B860|nr:VOC family protein [Paludisphaera soli]
MSPQAPSFHPALFYRDPAAALDWLPKAFGFRVLQDYRTPDGTVAHAELTYGSGILFLGGAKPDSGWRSPLDLAGRHQSVCVAVDDVDAHHDRALAAGAEIVESPKDTDYGSRAYTARDPEGHHWHFDSYRPKS